MENEEEYPELKRSPKFYLSCDWVVRLESYFGIDAQWKLEYADMKIIDLMSNLCVKKKLLRKSLLSLPSKSQSHQVTLCIDSSLHFGKSSNILTIELENSPI